MLRHFSYRVTLTASHTICVTSLCLSDLSIIMVMTHILNMFHMKKNRTKKHLNQVFFWKLNTSKCNTKSQHKIFELIA